MEIQTLKFINYVPRNADLREFVSRVEAVPSRRLEAQVAEACQRARGSLPDSQNLVSSTKRANYDLKRDVEKRMKRLNKKTQMAIYELGQELNKDEDEESD